MVIEIGTRSSPLALWQANAVFERLRALGHTPKLVPIESSGDLNLTQPIYEMGITGVFTKELDAALLQSKVRVAVHSLKDVPTQLADGIIIGATLERGAYTDVLILKEDLETITKNHLAIGTSSIRRRAQWLSKYPGQAMLPVRGNVQTRLDKFYQDNRMRGIIFAKAGLQRAGILPSDHIELNWMLPAPAQGAIAVVCRKEDDEIKDLLKKIDHKPTSVATTMEREFMRGLLGGCSVPVSALATFKNDTTIHFKGAIHSEDGIQHNYWESEYNVENIGGMGLQAASHLLEQPGARELMDVIKSRKYNS